MWDYIDAHPWLSFLYFSMVWILALLVITFRALNNPPSKAIPVEDRSGLS